MRLERINTLNEKLADETERRTASRGWEVHGSDGAAPVQLKVLFQGAGRKWLICRLGTWRLEPGTR